MSQSSITHTNVAGARRTIPVVSIRDYSSHREIARALSSGKKAVIFGMGLWGIVKAVEDPRTQARRSMRQGESREFWKVKAGRSRQSKIPMMVPPEHMARFIDFDRLHPRYHHLRRRRAREELWSHGGPFHGIFPFRTTTTLDDAFVTWPDELPEDRRVSYPTVSIFWMEDPAWHNLARWASRMATRAVLGVSSVNTHGEEPPFTWDELIALMEVKPEWDFDLVVRDEVTEAVELKSSHTQVRFPLKNEPPECVVIRVGSFSPDGFAKATGLPTRVHGSATVASRGHPPDLILDDRVWRAVKGARNCSPQDRLTLVR